MFNDDINVTLLPIFFWQLIYFLFAGQNWFSVYSYVISSSCLAMFWPKNAKIVVHLYFSLCKMNNYFYFHTGVPSICVRQSQRESNGLRRYNRTNVSQRWSGDAGNAISHGTWPLREGNRVSYLQFGGQQLATPLPSANQSGTVFMITVVVFWC